MAEDENNRDAITIRIMHELGQISGKLETMDKNMSSRMDMMRDDMLRAYQEHACAISDLRQEVKKMITESEMRTDKRLDELTERIEKLESEDKRLIEKVAGAATVGGGVGGTLVMAGMELIKRLGS